MCQSLYIGASREPFNIELRVELYIELRVEVVNGGKRIL